MEYSQVRDLIGFATDSSFRRSGKENIPIYGYIGRDFYRTIHYYRGEGRLVYTCDCTLVEIENDPFEDGYK